MAQVIDISIKSNIKTATKDTQDFASGLKAADQEVENLNQNLQIQGGVINNLEKELIGMEAKLRDTPKTGAAGFFHLQKAIAATKDEIKLEKIGMKELSGEMKNAQKVQKKYTNEIKKQERAQKKNTAAKKKASKATGIMGKATKLFGKALKGLGIGIIVSVLALLWKAMSKNKKVMKVVSTVVETLSSIFSQIVDVLVETYEWVTSSTDRFDGLKKVIGGLITLGLTPLKMTFYALKLAVLEVQLMWEKSIFGSGDTSKISKLRAGISETKNSMKEVAIAAIDAGKDIVNNIGDAIGEIGAIVEHAADGISKIDIKATYAASGALVEAQNNAIKLQAILEGKLAMYDRDIEAQQKIRDSENLTLQERYAAGIEVLKLIEEQAAVRLRLADLNIATAQREANANAASVEAQAALITAINERAAVEAEIQAQKDEQAEGQAALLEEQKVLEQEAYDKRIEDEAYLLELQQENLLASIENIREHALMELEIQKEKDIQAAMEHENFAAIIAEIDIKYQRKVDAVNKKADAADKKMAKINMKAKIDMAKQAFDGIATIMGKESKAGKAAAAASATISALQGATSAFASLAPIPFVGPVLGGIAAAAALVAGYANVKAIYATKTPGGGGGGGGGGGPQGETPAVTSIADSEAAEAVAGPTMTGGAFDLGAGGDAPGATQAYVVADDMTSSQEQLANIRRRASV